MLFVSGWQRLPRQFTKSGKIWNRCCNTESDDKIAMLNVANHWQIFGGKVLFGPACEKARVCINCDTSIWLIQLSVEKGEMLIQFSLAKILYHDLQRLYTSTLKLYSSISFARNLNSIYEWINKKNFFFPRWNWVLPFSIVTFYNYSMKTNLEMELFIHTFNAHGLPMTKKPNEAQIQQIRWESWQHFLLAKLILLSFFFVPKQQFKYERSLPGICNWKYQQ